MARLSKICPCQAMDISTENALINLLFTVPRVIYVVPKKKGGMKNED